MFMRLINKIKIQKFYINIRIIINDFVLDTMALFDIEVDSNYILEGLVPTKFFEKTSEKLSTTNDSKLKIKNISHQNKTCGREWDTNPHIL